MKFIILNLLVKFNIALAILKFSMRLHGFFYNLSSFLAVVVNGGTHPKHRILRYKEWFLEKIEANSIVLDVGSNTGAMASMLSEKAKYVYAIEINERLSKIAQEKNIRSNVEYINSDATTYDYKNCMPIDCVTLSNVLEHIDNRIDFLKLLRLGIKWNNLNHRLFLIRVPALDRGWLPVYKKEIGVEYRLDRTHTIEHTRQDLCDEIELSGLKIKTLDIRFGEYYLVCHG